MNWFYTKQIDVYRYSDDLYDENGVSIDGYTKVASMECDIQPMSAIKIEKEYGYNVECTKVIYSDNEIKESDIILYKDNTYKVTKSIEWDDYYITTIIEYEVAIKWLN